MIDTNEILEILGVGFGPSNMAIAVALKDANKKSNYLFLEAKKKFEWHSGMIMPEGQLQVPFFRDLATLRDPKSPHTFLNYLHEKKRLDLFINLRTFYPSRMEYHDYLTWISKKFHDVVRYSHIVSSIEPVIIKGLCTYFSVHGKNLLKNEEFCFFAKNIILGVGLSPNIPDCARLINDDRIIHTSNFSKQINMQFTNKKKKFHFIVVGAGQSAAESTQYLLNRYPNARISLCFRGSTLRGCDSNPFVNLNYHQNKVAKFYNYPQKTKNHILNELRNSNYSVIDSSILSMLYERIYYDTTRKKQSLLIKPFLDLQDITLEKDTVNGHFLNSSTDALETIQADAIILATGYKNDVYKNLLNNIASHVQKDNEGHYLVNSDYEISTEESIKARIFIQGTNEKTHGPSDQTLSVLSTRAQNILKSIG